MTTQTQGQHTPGPWHVEFETEIHAASVLRYAIAAVFHRGSKEIVNVSESIAQANARLIAAAPELLAVCQATVKNLEDWAASEDEREYDVTPQGLLSQARDLKRVIACATKQKEIQ